MKSPRIDVFMAFASYLCESIVIIGVAIMTSLLTNPLEKDSRHELSEYLSKVDFDQLTIRDGASSRLRHCPTLGKPLGCLKVAPGNTVAEWAEMTKQCLVAAITIVLVIVAHAAVSIYYPEITRPMFKLLTLGLAAVILSIAVAIAELRLRNARTIAVYEHGVRFADQRDEILNRPQFHWNEVDCTSNHVNVRWAFAFGRKSRLKIKFRLLDFSIRQKPHEVHLVANTGNNEINLAEYLCNHLGCNIWK